jgi:hypothetical protein
MSDSSSGREVVGTTQRSTYNSTVEAILRMRFSLVMLLEPVAKAFAAKTGTPNEAVEEIEAERRRLLALPPAELQREYAREATAVEARKFYNVPSAMADFAHWSQMDYWSVEEAVTLLLGREPSVVNSASLKKHQTSRFAQRHTKLLQIAQRSETLGSSDRVKPAAAVEWAILSGAVEPPPDLERWLRSRARLPERKLASEAPTDVQVEAAPVSNVRWTPERLKELSEFRERHGTKKAAEHFGIAQARVRQLLPKKPAASPASSAFTYRPK